MKIPAPSCPECQCCAAWQCKPPSGAVSSPHQTATTASAVPHADVLDLNHEAITSERRSRAKMKRVQTVGGRLHELSPVTTSVELTMTLCKDYR